MAPQEPPILSPQGMPRGAPDQARPRLASPDTGNIDMLPAIVATFLQEGLPPRVAAPLPERGGVRPERHDTPCVCVCIARTLLDIRTASTSRALREQ